MFRGSSNLEMQNQNSELKTHKSKELIYLQNGKQKLTMH